ncbi:MAG: zf-HC2 domain-containing protein [Terracidiphilus sp.]|jgi:hypothetical protein
MAERTNIPSSPACGQWETLLADALDGLLKPEDEAVFTAHMAVCPACAALFEEARKGREWLEFLSPEPEVPVGLLDRILAQTGPGQVEGFGLVSGGSNVLQMPPVSTPARRDRAPGTPAWQRPGLVGQARRFAEPRLLMTAAMAFFSITLTLNLTGVHLSSVRLSDLRPTALRSIMERRLNMASTPIIRYYDHLRFVHEVESRMRELRRATQGEGEGTDNDNRQKQKDAQPAAPGESKQAPGEAPGRKGGGFQIDPPQQSANPAFNDSTDFLETSLTFQDRSSTPATKTYRWGPGLAQSGGSATAVQERSTKWTA